MSYRKVVNTLVLLISILFVNLLTSLISDLGFKYLKNMDSAKATLIGMGATVFILYPAYSYIDKWSEKLTKKVFNAGKNAAGKFIGLLLVFIAAICLLFIAYLKVWFNVWYWDVLAAKFHLYAQ